MGRKKKENQKKIKEQSLERKKKTGRDGENGTYFLRRMNMREKGCGVGEEKEVSRGGIGGGRANAVAARTLSVDNREKWGSQKGGKE